MQPKQVQGSLPGPEIAQRFATLDYRQPSAVYNFEHFRTQHLLSDVQATLAVRGIQPGEQAPDFTLPRSDGGEVQLSALRGKPVLLHFGSPT
ncbi:MAG: redoxin domain-containing protein [Caldilineaceae bacterium]